MTRQYVGDTTTHNRAIPNSNDPSDDELEFQDDNNNNRAKGSPNSTSDDELEFQDNNNNKPRPSKKAIVDDSDEEEFDMDFARTTQVSRTIVDTDDEDEEPKALTNGGSTDGMEIKGLDSNIEFLKVVDEDKPVFDPETEKVTISEVEEGEELKRKWVKSNLTAEELKKRSDAKADRDEKDAVKKLRKRIKNPKDTDTVEDQLKRLNRAVALILKDF